MNMTLNEASVLIVYKNFAAYKNISHIGLGVAALNNQKILRALGLKVDVLPAVSSKDLVDSLAKESRTHVVVSALWFPTADIQAMCHQYSDTAFFVNCHSNVGFLQADTNGITLLRQAINLQQATHNFSVAGNTRRFCEWLSASFGTDCQYLPNCYYLDSHTPTWHVFDHNPGQQLRIGIFGAIRPLKNMLTGAAAALEVSRQLRRPLELWVSGGRTEGGGQTIVNAIQAMLAGLPGVDLRISNWTEWPDFRRLIGQMHLLLQPSYTESFNMVTADGICVGVPSVCSDAIDWVPKYWIAPSDDPVNVAETAIRVLHHPSAAADGYAALVRHNSTGVRSWGRALEIANFPRYLSALDNYQSHKYELAE
jgi:hypothetical protein